MFYNAPLCYALCNIKPILPGHVLVIPYRPVERLTDLTTAEVTDVFTTVQKVQRMLAKLYFKTPGSDEGKPENGRSVQVSGTHFKPNSERRNCNQY